MSTAKYACNLEPNDSITIYDSRIVMAEDGREQTFYIPDEHRQDMALDLLREPDRRVTKTFPESIKEYLEEAKKTTAPEDLEYLLNSGAYIALGAVRLHKQEQARAKQEEQSKQVHQQALDAKALGLWQAYLRAQSMAPAVVPASWSDVSDYWNVADLERMRNLWRKVAQATEGTA